MAGLFHLYQTHRRRPLLVRQCHAQNLEERLGDGHHVSYSFCECKIHVFAKVSYKLALINNKIYRTFMLASLIQLQTVHPGNTHTIDASHSCTCESYVFEYQMVYP